jgi:uncharacterized membrane protein/thiol-disulfide isomerase/thioredoxin
MARARKHASAAPSPGTAPPRVMWLAVAALVGLGFSAASTWVHYRILHDPFYSSVCDVNATFSCSEAYTSRYGSVGSVPVALLGVLYFAFVLVLIGISRRSSTALRNLSGYIFALSTVGLAGVLYLGYASAFVLQTVCLLCVGSYAAIIALFLLSGATTRYPMTSLPGRASRDLRTLVRTPAALTAAVSFLAAAALAIVFFPGEPISASATAPATEPAVSRLSVPPPPAQLSASAMQQLEQFIATGPRVPLLVAATGASVVIVKFNDYQCPPCRQTHLEYKPVLAKLQQQYPGKIAFVTRDFPLDPECNSLGGGHQAACEAAVSVRLAREKGKADAMEEWLFANQPQLTPALVKSGVQQVAGVTNFDERYAGTLELVKGDIAQGLRLQPPVNGTPTFFMNGLRLPNLRGEFFESAVLIELRRVGVAPPK